jgi:ATP-dependent DNA ligase
MLGERLWRAHAKRGGAQAVLVAFDLLRLVGVDERLRPIEARREALMLLVAGANIS